MLAGNSVTGGGRISYVVGGECKVTSVGWLGWWCDPVRLGEWSKKGQRERERERGRERERERQTNKEELEEKGEGAVMRKEWVGRKVGGGKVRGYV